jgi:hypothetical protein
MHRPVSTHGRRPAINALVTAGEGPSIRLAFVNSTPHPRTLL